MLSYASHVWGPSVFASCISKGQHLSADADGIHLHFLRMLTGTGKKGCADVLVRDMHRSPVMHHWVVLAARWWTKLAEMDPQVPRIARSAWLSDIALMRGAETGGRVYAGCWSHQLLSTLQCLGVLTAAEWAAEF